MAENRTLSLFRLPPNHNFKPFDCGDSDLNEFLLESSIDYMTRLLSVTYIIETDEWTKAFFSVSNDKISIKEMPSKEFEEKFQDPMPEGKKYRSYPAVKIGRLGVNNTFQRQGFGGKMLDYIKYMFIDNNRTGCQYITVDAYAQSLKFYLDNGFKYLTDKDVGRDTRQMYYNLMDLR